MCGYILEHAEDSKNSSNLLKTKECRRLKKVHVRVHISGMKMSFKNISQWFQLNTKSLQLLQNLLFWDHYFKISSAFEGFLGLFGEIQAVLAKKYWQFCLSVIFSPRIRRNCAQNGLKWLSVWARTIFITVWRFPGMPPGLPTMKGGSHFRENFRLSWSFRGPRQ